MKKIFVYIGIAIAFSSCGSQQQYAVISKSGERILVDQTVYPDSKMVALVDKYKGHLDREMGQVIGSSDEYMTFDRPESLLTNLTSDVMLQLDPKFSGGKSVDVAVMNVHGHRANLPKGDITVGNIFEIYSFDNALAVLEMKGSDLLEIFESYAQMGGAGISDNVKLIIENKKLLSVTINGLSIDKTKVYKIVTLDYLADGNDGMEAFKKAISVEYPGIILRDYMMDYVKKQTAEGKVVSSKLDGRIVVK